MRKFGALLSLLSLAIFLTGCGGDNANSTVNANSRAAANVANGQSSGSTVSPSIGSEADKVTKIDVYEKEMSITLSRDTVPAGYVDFVARNDGERAHELVVFKTDVPFDKLPMKGSDLDEKGAGLKNVADTGEENLKSGEVRILHASLDPGSYIVVCNLPGHFKAGMKATLTVK